MAAIEEGSRVRDVNPDRAADREHDPRSGTGTVFHIEYETYQDAMWPEATYWVQFDNNRAGADPRALHDLKLL